MFRLSAIFSNRARGRVLETLYHYRGPIHLRHLASLTDLPVHSVERALEQLRHERFIKKNRRGHRVEFSINPKHPNYDLLRKIFDFVDAFEMQKAADKHSIGAHDVLRFASSTTEFFKNIKRPSGS